MAERSEFPYSDNSRDDVSEELGSLSLGASPNEEGYNEDTGNPGSGQAFEVDTIEDFGQIVFDMLRADEVMQYHFPNVDIAYEFYNEYGKARGFSIRKHKVLRSKGDGTLGDIIWKSFVCSRQGARDVKHIEKPDRQRESRPITRCGCKAEFRVHIHPETGRWYVSFFSDEHNHELVADKFLGRLRSQRRMTDGDRAEMNNMRNVGISMPKVFSSFAQQAGGFANVGFTRKKMYNEQQKERKERHGDAKAALSFLREMASIDPKVYWRHEVDGEGNLRNLFWCDGDSVADYIVFGDILAFDATYGRNRYKCPVVVFSGVNHHLQTVVFACAMVSDETEQTYTWILEQFVAAMDGKSPKAVITDGDRAMKNAIARVFPDAHHRLCAWHLLRNATANVGKPRFTSGFGRCMFGDYEVEEFEEKWKTLVTENDVENVTWVMDIYAKKKMWATAYMRGSFFAGIRTTSRCEGLHTQIGRYVGSRDSLYEFLKHFQRCLNYMRNNEVEADLKSCYGDPVLQSCLPTLEHSAAKTYTVAVFKLFRDRLKDVGCVNVVGHRQTANSVLFVVKKYTVANVRSEWHVCFYPNEMEWRCPCKGMESFGIPCIHILKTLVHLGIHELPPSLVCRRWSKNAKEGFEHTDSFGNTSNATNRCTRYAALQHCCKRLCSVACRSLEDFNRVRETVNGEIEQLLSKNRSTGPSSGNAGVDVDANVGDPVRVRTKGCGSSAQVRDKKMKKARRCTNCREEGHNKRRCPDSQGSQPAHNTCYDDSADEDEFDGGEDGDADVDSESERENN